MGERRDVQELAKCSKVGKEGHGKGWAEVIEEERNLSSHNIAPTIIFFGGLGAA